jgi:hypothetical protein
MHHGSCLRKCSFWELPRTLKIETYKRTYILTHIYTKQSLNLLMISFEIKMESSLSFNISIIISCKNNNFYIVQTLYLFYSTSYKIASYGKNKFFVHSGSYNKKLNIFSTRLYMILIFVFYDKKVFSIGCRGFVRRRIEQI